MTRRVSGWLNAVWDPAHPAPFVSAIVELNGTRHELDFFVDTGSDITCIMPRDSLELLGSRLFGTSFRKGAESTIIVGVGESGYYALELEDAALILVDEVGVEVRLDVQLWLAEPSPRDQAPGGNWSLPSIFGRDAIRPGDFHVSYIENTVSLIRPDHE